MGSYLVPQKPFPDFLDALQLSGMITRSLVYLIKQELGTELYVNLWADAKVAL